MWQLQDRLAELQLQDWSRECVVSLWWSSLFHQIYISHSRSQRNIVQQCTMSLILQEESILFHKESCKCSSLNTGRCFSYLHLRFQHQKENLQAANHGGCSSKSCFQKILDSTKTGFQTDFQFFLVFRPGCSFLTFRLKSF